VNNLCLLAVGRLFPGVAALYPISRSGGTHRGRGYGGFHPVSSSATLRPFSPFAERSAQHGVEPR